MDEPGDVEEFIERFGHIIADADISVVPADLAALPPHAVVCDLNPETSESAFLRLAAGRGHRTLDGLGMLARQGAAAFKAWTGVEAPLEVMIRALGG